MVLFEYGTTMLLGSSASCTGLPGSGTSAVEVSAAALEVLMAKQREIQTAQYKKYIGTNCEVMVEGRNEARGQWIGRTTHNKTLNFTAPQAADPKSGTYAPVLVTGSFPNSLLGEMVV